MLIKQKAKHNEQVEWCEFHSQAKNHTKDYKDLDGVLRDLANKWRPNQYLRDMPYKKRKVI